MDPRLKGAAPQCHECEKPIERVEHKWHVDEDGTWRLVGYMVCSNNHRVIVEPLIGDN